MGLKSVGVSRTHSDCGNSRSVVSEEILMTDDMTRTASSNARPSSKREMRGKRPQNENVNALQKLTQKIGDNKDAQVDISKVRLKMGEIRLGLRC